MNLGYALSLAAAPQLATALSKIPSTGGADRGLQQEESRELMHFTVVFDECLGQTLEACKSLIQAAVDKDPAIFEGRTFLNYDVNKIREGGDSGYYLVGLRTNEDETGVTGILGDGMVWYPWDWCDTNGCQTIGPWDCDVGTPLTVEQCCNMIKATVPNPDLQGNMLDCYPDYPVGSASNPVDYGRVTIHVNGEGKVVHAPRNE